MDWEVWEMNSLLLVFFWLESTSRWGLKWRQSQVEASQEGFSEELASKKKKGQNDWIQFDNTREKKEPALLPARSSIDDFVSGINNVFNRAFVSL